MSKHVPPPTGEPLERLDNLVMAVPPKWGEAILRLAKATERVAAKLDEMPGAADVQYIPKARELAKSLIDFLDGVEDTDQDAAIDDGPCDTDELEIAEGDDEPSLGSTGHGSGGPISYRIPVVSAGGEMIHDCEGDEHDGREDVGDRRSYQMDPANAREALDETAADSMPSTSTPSLDASPATAPIIARR